MKTKLLFLLFSSFCFVGFSQNYERIADSSKKWNVVTEMNPTYTPYVPAGTYNLILGDVVNVNDILYYQVLINGNFRGNYIREDAMNRVYIAPGINGDAESLLYDFNVQVGDIVQNPSVYLQSYHISTVTDVTTIVVNGETKKLIFLASQYGFDDQWIEGIGSMFGLLTPGENVVDMWSTLLCYYKNEELILSNRNTCNFSVPSPIYEISYFRENTFEFDHFLLNDTVIEYPNGDTDASFLTLQGSSNNELLFNYNGLCFNGTSADVLINNDNTMNILIRHGTTLASCSNAYPDGDAQEGRFFTILTGNQYMQPSNPLLVHYEKSTNGAQLMMWNDENEKLVFNAHAIIGTDDALFNDNFKLYPNPATDVLTISSKITDYDIEIYSVLGKKVLDAKSTSVANQLNISKLNSGIYTVKLKTILNSTIFKLIKK